MSIEVLPIEIFHVISDYLNTKEVARLSETNKLCNELSKDRLDNEKKAHQDRKEKVEAIVQYMKYNPCDLIVDNRYGDEDTIKFKSILDEMGILLEWFDEALELEYKVYFHIESYINETNRFRFYINIYGMVDGLVDYETDDDVDELMLSKLLRKIFEHNIKLYIEKKIENNILPEYIQYREPEY